MRRRLWLLPLLAGMLGMVLVGCGTNAPPGPAESPVMIPKTTKILDATTRASLLAYDPTTGELRFGSQATFGSLAPDDVLVTQPIPPLAPYGFLRKVVSVQTVNSQIVVETVPAQLTEAIHQGSFKLDQQLKPSMLASVTVLAQGVSLQSDNVTEQFTVPLNKVVLFDADGDHSTTGDQISASGSFTLNPVLHIGGGLHFHVCCDVQSRFNFSIGLNQSVHVTLTAGGQAQVKKEVPLLDMTFDPIDIQIGPFPLVFVPKLQVVADLNGSVTEKLSFTAAENLTLTAGTDKPYGQGFHDISTAKVTGSSDASGLSYQYPGVTFWMQPAVNARFQILLYDLVGPQATLGAYLRFDLQIPGQPAWTVKAGLTGKLGLHVAVLNYNWDKTVFDISKVVAQQTGNSPPELTAADIEPADGSSVQLGVPVTFAVSGGDVEDGQITHATWVSDVDGDITAAASSGSYTFNSAVTRHITVTITDSAGAKAQVTITVNVLDTPPVATLSNPQPARTVYVGNPTVLLQGSAVDANEPGGQLACTRLHWSSSGSQDVLPADGCADPTYNANLQVATFNGALGTHTVTLTATDPQGMSDTKTTTVDVLATPTNYAPSGNITKPKENASFGDSEPIDLGATLIDQDDDTLSYSWDILDPSGTVVYLKSGTASGASTTTGGVTTGVDIGTTAPGLACQGENAPYTIELTVNDSHTFTVSNRSITCSYIPR